MDSIFSLVTPPGRGAIAVMRVSGPIVCSLVERLTQRPIPEARVASLRKLINPNTGTLIDHALLILMPGPNSFTGEDVVEFHLHASPAILAQLTQVFQNFPNLRQSEPGEFTKRAFLNDRMDLIEAEGIADLINAETEQQHQQALAQLEGTISQIYQGWTDSLKGILAHYEAYLDFPDEDLPADITSKLTQQLYHLADEIARNLNDAHTGEIIRDGLKIVIIGEPNVGKSSLMNALAKRDVAIVSEHAGTTRDILHISLNLAGFQVHLYDTAGIREATDQIEQEGIRRAKAAIDSAHLLLFMIEAGTLESMRTQYETLQKQLANTLSKPQILLVNKTDQFPGVGVAELVLEQDQKIVKLSVKDGKGLDQLITEIQSHLQTHFQQTSSPVITRERHRHLLEQARESILRSFDAPYPELRCEELRLALRSLGSITGRVDVEDLLDIIFRDFCIGK